MAELATTQRVFGFAGWSGSGKTTLIEKVIAHLCHRGYRISLVKHAHHEFDIDHPGKDSFRHRQAGAAEILISSARRWALMHEIASPEAELSLAQALAQLSPCDLVLVEGYKHASIPKLEVYRASVGKPLLHQQDPYIQAIASEKSELGALPALPCFALDDIAGIAHFILKAVGLAPR
ncbi:MAG: Molybdopterin-guanine dinucleotide biosynthesis adapter protein [Pseudomonadota bacterium]|jgi:molybdopterin-guanine dinucleotide biosynthesis protein B